MPKPGHFILHSNVIPQLTAGKYELVTEHKDLPFTVAPEHTHITVTAPRFTMPTEQILSSFPPANAEGAFGDRLPQIVLKRRTLPWERNPAGALTPSSVPWLALVVVAEGEAQLSTATPVAECVTADANLLDLHTDQDVEQGLYLAVTETVVKKIFPCQEDLELLVHVREVDINDTELANGDDDGWLAVVLANRLPVFDAANNKPVRYMACLVNIEGQLPALPQPEPSQNQFTFELAQDWSVLAAINPQGGPDTRVMGGIALDNVVLPTPGGVRDAAPRRAVPNVKGQAAFASPSVGASLHGAAAMAEKPISQQWTNVTDKVSAVALDPDAKRLVRDTMGSGFRYPIEHFALEKVLRFPVLAHWSFTTTEGATFETLMQEIDVSLLGTAPQTEANAPGAPAPEVVQTGHIGLGHRSRRGDAVRAWYRGPCVPFPVLREEKKEGALPPLAHASDQLRRVVPDGREDLTKAAAFEIGRLLALSQLSVVSALLRFRSEQFGIGRIRELLAQVTPFPLPEIVDQRIDLGRFVSMQMIDTLVKNPTLMIGPRRPIADPGRELEVRGDLDKLIATGLGIDLDALGKMSKQIGLLSALAKTEVPLAHRPGNVEFDERAVAGLRSALNNELNRVLSVAAPRPDLRSGRSKRAAAPLPDVLDTLIARAAELADSNEEEN